MLRTVLEVVLKSLFVGGGMVVLATYEVFFGPKAWVVLAAFTVLAFAWPVWSYLRRQKKTALLVDELPADRHRILYLRSFSSDWSVAGAVLRVLRSALSGVTYGLVARSLETSEEEQIAMAFGPPRGEFIAIGQPGETLPSAGARKIYATDEEWRGVVTGQMATADLVILRAGEGDGLLWEIEAATRNVDPRRLVIAVLNSTRGAYHRFRETADPCLPQPLPADPPTGRLGSFRNLGRSSFIITFSETWQPQAKALRAPWYRQVVAGPKVDAARWVHTMRARMTELGIAWAYPSSTAAVVAIVSIAVFMGSLRAIVALGLV